jgi:hypothetical protein
LLIRQDPNVWKNEPVQRVSFKPAVAADESYDPNWAYRMQTLGNTVVPAVVREAFVELATTACRWNTIAECLHGFGLPASDMCMPYPASAIIKDGTVFALPQPCIAPQKHTVSIHVRAPGAASDNPSTIGNYPTPRRGIVHGSALTERSMHDLPTVLMNSQESIEYVRSTGVEVDESKLHASMVASSRYVEWMMGYPADWTKIDTVRSRPASNEEPTASEEGIVSEKKWVRAPRGRQDWCAGDKEKFKNGFHLLMAAIKEQGGKHDLKACAEQWRALSDEERAAYTAKAKADKRA